MVVVAVGARGGVLLVLLVRGDVVGVHRGALVVGERRGVRGLGGHLLHRAVARDAGLGVHRDHGRLGGGLVAELHVGVLGRERGLVGVALDAGHALGLVGRGLRAGRVGRRRGLDGVAHRAVGVHRPVHRLAVHGRRAAVPVLLLGRRRSRGLRLRRAARERPHRGREREDDAEDGEHDEAPVGGVCLHGHALLLTSSRPTRRATPRDGRICVPRSCSRPRCRR